jgi:N utilization substance protein B
MGEPYRTAWGVAREEAHLNEAQRELVEDVLGVLERRGAEIDATLAGAALHWQIERLAATDRSVLRTAIAELMGRAGTPARVVLDEAIEIAKRFGSDQSGRFVNGVLDQVARALRPEEF